MRGHLLPVLSQLILFQNGLELDDIWIPKWNWIGIEHYHREQCSSGDVRCNRKKKIVRHLWPKIAYVQWWCEVQPKKVFFFLRLHLTATLETVTQKCICSSRAQRVLKSLFLTPSNSFPMWIPLSTVLLESKFDLNSKGQGVGCKLGSKEEEDKCWKRLYFNKKGLNHQGVGPQLLRVIFRTIFHEHYHIRM